MIPIYNRKSMHPARIAELLQPFLTDPCQSGQGQGRGEEPASALLLNNISTYIDLLLRWNSRINLTAIRDAEEIVTRHFGESLFAACHLFPSVSFSLPPVPSAVKGADLDCSSIEKKAKPTRAADLGSGAGFPGIPIKLWSPGISMTLIESNQKKATFLREVVRALILTGIDVQSVRAETISETFDIVTLRAVERFTQVLPTAAQLTRPSGRLVLLLSSLQEDEAHSTLPTFGWSGSLPIPPLWFSSS